MPEQTALASMVGEIITSATIGQHAEPSSCDDWGLLTLTMRSGRVFHVQASYDGYTGESCDEYPEVIYVSEIDPEGAPRG
jgi:hypothetical protein